MVVYKDLKPQNVLVWSLDPESKVNIKLSDYGLSCYLTPQGIKGFEGTLGYQAPEMRTGSSYNEKVNNIPVESIKRYLQYITCNKAILGTGSFWIYLRT